MDEGSTHWEDCWKEHPECALVRVQDLETQIQGLKIGAALQKSATLWWREKFFRILECFETMEGTLYEMDWDIFGVSEKDAQMILDCYQEWKNKQEKENEPNDS